MLRRKNGKNQPENKIATNAIRGRIQLDRAARNRVYSVHKIVLSIEKDGERRRREGGKQGEANHVGERGESATTERGWDPQLHPIKPRVEHKSVGVRDPLIAGEFSNGHGQVIP